MTKIFTIALLAGTASLSAGASGQTAPAPAPAPMSGMAMAAPAPAVESPLVGGAIGGITNAVWADQNNDGVVDGYVQNGQYYVGTPAGYDPMSRRVAAAAPGAMSPAVGVASGAVLGGAVGGVPGAVWSDNNGDGQVDGYVQNGQYYPGAPQAMSTDGPAPTTMPPPPVARGERG